MFRGLTPLRFLSVALAGWLNRRQRDIIDYLLEENHVFREHVGKRKLRFTDAQRQRLATAAHRLGRETLDELTTLVRPATLLRWHRELVALKWTYTRRGPGRPRTSSEAVALIIRMARENPSWGCDRIVGALSNLGFTISPSTVRNVLRRNGIQPAPQRKRRLHWETFLRAHWELLFAADFFTVEVWTPRGLVTHYALFAIHLASRRVALAGITTNPDAAFMAQVARQLTDPFDGPFKSARFLIIDRDKKFTSQFRSALLRAGITPVLCPPHAPNCNAYAERFVRSIKEECLSKVVPIGTASLRRAVCEYVSHYHAERNHQGIGNRLICPDKVLPAADGVVVAKHRLGGLLSYYQREAA